MTSFDVSLTGAFIAGILSFFSPCVLPLVPAYLCYLGGMSMEQLVAEENHGSATTSTRQIFIAALGFVAGFGSVFVALGASATVLGQLIAEYMGILGKIAGVVIIVFGLHFAGLFRLRFLEFEHRFQTQQVSAGPLGGYVMGLAFAFGWTPCIGPVLATILMMAASEDSVTDGVVLLGVYALGIGVPFLLAAFAVHPFLRFMRRFRRHMRWVEIGTGALLVVTGILIFTGSLAVVGNWLLPVF
uniref:Cytochrome c-type biogenesis protein n=1 Tax=Candidatus Kentrum sp. FW TaxID=2126338 RepID=A0A450T4N1_9GAMM|nr:MAG: cytochrome c-type biogenesis protein [Candidatus Kentron sp. FW]